MQLFPLNTANSMLFTFSWFQWLYQFSVDISHIMIDHWLWFNTVSCWYSQALCSEFIAPEKRIYLATYSREDSGNICPLRSRVLLLWLVPLCPRIAGGGGSNYGVSLSPPLFPLSAAAPPSSSILHLLLLCCHNSSDLSLTAAFLIFHFITVPLNGK